MYVIDVGTAVQFCTLYSIFHLALEPVILEPAIQTNITAAVLNVTTQSDYDTLDADCQPERHSTFCFNSTFSNEDCSKTFNITGKYGCTYHCTVRTSKENYTPVVSNATVWIIGRNLYLDATFRISCFVS